MIVVDDGHDIEQLNKALDETLDNSSDRPTMIIANTIKGEGVSFLEDADGWHGKAVDDDQLRQALDELGEVDRSLRGLLPARSSQENSPGNGLASISSNAETKDTDRQQYAIGSEIATRDAYGNALKRLARSHPELIALDGEVSNSTRSQKLQEDSPEQFLEMYIAEQNMVGMATGLALRGRIPFVSSFAAFLTRAFDQIRMAVYSEANVKFVGSHCGVSIGQDGPSQMGLEDIAMFRTLHDSVVLYPCDAVSTERLMDQLIEHRGISYLRTTRGKTPVIYRATDPFRIGGSQVLRASDSDAVTLIGAGITLHAALSAAEQLAEQGIQARVIDLYSIKPLDVPTLTAAARQTSRLVVVEDHFVAGGICEAIRSSLWDGDVSILSLAVTKRPRSGSPEQLLKQQEIDAEAICRAAKAMCG